MFDGDFLYDFNYLEGQTEEIAQYIYLDTNKRILKYKANLTSMDVANAIEKYINNTSLYDFNILDKKHAETTIPLKFLREVGKFRLEDNLIKTNNYLVPRSTSLLIFLKNLYQRCINGVCKLTRYEFNDLYDIMMESYDNKYYKDVDIILDLCSGLNIELVEEYNINKESICETMKNIRDLTSLDDRTFQTLSNLGIIVNSLNCNVDQICKLGLENKFIEATKIKKQAQKVK